MAVTPLLGRETSTVQAAAAALLSPPRLIGDSGSRSAVK
jgi:hypothetical protein